jgi:hypothetical protein
MGRLNIGHGIPPLIDRQNKVGPESANVVPIALRLLQLRFLVFDFLLRIRRVKRPSIFPTDMKNALRPVKIGPDAMLLIVVVSKLS